MIYDIYESKDLNDIFYQMSVRDDADEIRFKRQTAERLAETGYYGNFRSSYTVGGYYRKKSVRRANIESYAELELLREPNNAYDENAIAVLCDNIQIGYLPREVSAQLAATIDAGGDIRVIIDQHTSYPSGVEPEYDWDTRILLFGDDLPESLVETECRETKLQDDEVLYLNEKIREMQFFVIRSNLATQLRREQIARLLCPEEFEFYRPTIEEICEGNIAKDPATYMMQYKYFDQAPINLKTVTTWNSLGYKPSKDAEVYATVGYYKRSRFMCYDLYHAADVVAKKVTPKTIEAHKRAAMERLLNPVS